MLCQIHHTSISLRTFLVVVYGTFSVDMYKAGNSRYTSFLSCLRLPNALLDTSIWKTKKNFVIKISSFFMPQLERFLIFWYDFCSCEPNMKHSVSSTFLLYLVGACPNLKDSSFYGTFFLFICIKHKAFGIFHFFALSAIP